MTSAEEISKMFDSESQKLSSLFDVANSKIDMSIHEIVETYYQVMNVSSMATMLEQQPESEELIEKTRQIKKLISERFDSDIHPKIVEHLSVSIQELTKILQSRNSSEKSKEQTESDAKSFDELRQTMSTKEFVEQYENMIFDD